MALTIEDGSNVESANSYQSVDDLRTFATSRNITNLPSDDSKCEVLLLEAMDALTEFAGRWQGRPANSGQALPWPRSGVKVDHLQVDPDSIPYELRYAQLQLAIQALDNDLMPNEQQQHIVKEKVGPIEVTYENKGRVLGVSAFSKPMALIRPLLKSGLSLVRS